MFLLDDCYAFFFIIMSQLYFTSGVNHFLDEITV